ncbi:hypothetical protein BU16DRAFT_562579 [Lophium mytilinum]|uniref:Peptidase S8/S53 domain-containing protein n=1 Tax=Lophium mytilinum TaxID=390894 RepID=A0A6A6QS67_9PEZI|nr:hypothetical protein BU16DRAFT_562579 [Lophium mytilinum]
MLTSDHSDHSDHNEQSDDQQNDDHSDTSSEPGSDSQHGEPTHDEHGDDDDNLDDDAWAEGFHTSRKTLDDQIHDDLRVLDAVWASGSKDDQYRALLEDCLGYETCGKAPPNPQEDESLSILQFIIRKLIKLVEARLQPTPSMARMLVRLIIELAKKKGSEHLLSILHATKQSDDSELSSRTQPGGKTQTDTAEGKKQREDWKETSSPLFMAIKFDQKAKEPRGLTVFLCETLPEEDREKALAAKNQNNESWLHAAILEDLEGVEDMIKWAPKSVFCEARKGNKLDHQNTPLHDALNYKNHVAPFPLCPGTHFEIQPRPEKFAPELESCRQDAKPARNPCLVCVDAAKMFQGSWVRRGRIVSELLKRDIEALRVHNASGRSPYLYYLATRDAYLKATNKISLPSTSRPQGSLKNIASPNPRTVNPAKGANTRKGNPKNVNNEIEEEEKAMEMEKENERGKGKGKQRDETSERNAVSNTESENGKKPEKSNTSEKAKGPDDGNGGPNNDNRPGGKSVKYEVSAPKLEEPLPAPKTQERDKPVLKEKAPLVRRMSQTSSISVPRSNTQSNTTKRRHTPQKSNAFKPHKEKQLPEKELSEGLESSLKEKAYAIGGYEEAVDCLFRKPRDDQESAGDEENRLQNWSFEKKEDRISMNTTKDFNYLTFEPMISSLRIDLNDTASEQELETMSDEKRLSARRKDMQRDLVGVFQWLKGTGKYKDKGKGVKGIMRLVVNDRAPYFCSDETMEKCLENLEVRYLDWNRPDICTDTLRLIPDLVQVDLYWGGLQAVLNSWGDANGLCKLERLRSVNLHAERGQETEDRMKQYVKQFTKKSQEWQRWDGTTKLPHVHDFYSNAINGGETRRMDPKTGDSKSDNHPWFVKVEEFGMHLKELSLKGEKIKVAVIDDGVSPTYQRVGEYLHNPGWPFKGARAQENFTSTHHHGSKMAYLITRICPYAEIYVAKLDADTSTSFRQRTFSLEAAKTAVEWATSQKVDIISMSWNVRRKENKGENDPGNEVEVNELHKAINTAATDRGILMYCAAGDNMGGIGKDQKWVPCDLENTHSIGATDIHGSKKPYVVDNEKLAYLFPGENILQEADKDSKDVGNSGATALAAGLAAMVLFLTRAHGINVEGPSVRPYMNKVFKNVFNASSAQKVVQIANVLEKTAQGVDKFRDKLKAEAST